MAKSTLFHIIGHKGSADCGPRPPVSSLVRTQEELTVVLPEFVPARWWQHLLHNQRALFFKRILLFEPWTVAVSVPFHVGNGRTPDAA